MKKLLSILSLFTSSGTLLCCALPFFLVSVGAGAVAAGLASNVPGLIWLSMHKVKVFLVAGAMLAINVGLQKYQKQTACAVDNQEACEQAKDYSTIILRVSIVIYLIGGFFAFVLPRWI